MGCSVRCGRDQIIGATYNREAESLSAKSLLFVKENSLKFASVYRMGPLIGIGRYSEVHICTHLSTGSTRAVKVVKKTLHRLETGNAEDLSRELEITVSLDHPNINRVIEYFNEKYTLYMIMEHCEGGELVNRLVEKRKLNENKAACIMKQVLGVVVYMHSVGVVHRDLKPGNILFQSKDRDEVKIIDFGLAAYKSPIKPLTGMVGTPYYVSPEVITGHYDEKCDEWSVGVIMYLMLSGVPPFEGNSTNSVLQKIQALQYNTDKGIWKSITPEAIDLVRKLLTPAEGRITAEMALNHRWIQRFSNPSEPQSPIFAEVFSNMKAYRRGSVLKEAALAYISTQKLAMKDEMRLREVFRALDTNSDGRISAEEIIQGSKKRKAESLTELEANEIIDRIGRSGRGFIDYTEFIKSACARRVLLTKANLISAFSVLDDDRSGTISAEEVRKSLGICQLKQPLIDRIVSEVDENGDGQIDIQEFTHMMEDS